MGLDQGVRDGAHGDCPAVRGAVPEASVAVWNSSGAWLPRTRNARPGRAMGMAAASPEPMTSIDSGPVWTRRAMQVVTLARMSAFTAPCGRWVAMMRWIPSDRPMAAILMSSASAAGASSTRILNSSMTITRYGIGGPGAGDDS